MIRKLGIVLVHVALVGLVLAAQTVTPVQHIAAHQDTAAQVCTVAASATACTLTPNGGELVYVYQLDVQNCTNATGVAPAAQTNITTSNLTGSPIWMMASGSNNAGLLGVGNCAQSFSISYPGGLRSTTIGTAVVFTLPTFAAQQTIRMNIAWRSGPVF